MPGTSERSQLGRDYLWNTAASLMTSLATVVMLLVVTRTAGIRAAGVYSLAIAVGQQFQTLGMYEVRTYHVTDLRHRFTFGTYLATRIVTVALMLAGIVGYAMVSGDGGSDVLLIVLVASLRVFDAFEDVYVCELQRVGRLDLGGRACFWRALSTTASFSGMLVATGNLLVSTVVSLVVSLVVMVGVYLPPSRGLFPLRPTWDPRRVGQVLLACLPLFLASFISMYLSNAPRFAIDRYLDPTQQGYFAILFMPAVTINLMSLVIFRPLLTRMAGLWVQGDRPGFRAVVNRGLLATAGAFVVVGLVTYVAGVPILGLVFGKDVSAFSVELMVLVAGGAMNAASVVLYYALTTVRLQNLVFAGYVLAAGAITLLCVVLVPQGSLLGASVAYTAAMSVLVAVFAVVLYRAVTRR
ncbi:lipopolysaccharide biosynthesis protein [Actinomyces sp. oral taxon 897]|uniref:lipopolysaccharide biosynthesis protein n=1 Tax=Actinomyces sp. oral taxon 897 TaxID=2081702 RepID=UPI000D02DDA7|nr:lipopolysaccharide biosynthesis protein [Actinomyces sp. oral taxon 897]AVM61674.1 polysaccharide biosynthesis protein [Actinomyces sp. oral taxon 897]